MTVALAWDLQLAIVRVVKDAAPGVAVFDHVPMAPPEEYIRLDGFGLSDMSAKREERARHHFEIHHFLRPAATQNFKRGQKAGKLVLADIHAALMADPILNQPLQHETMDVSADSDGVTVHARSRYSVIL